MCVVVGMPDGHVDHIVCADDPVRAVGQGVSGGAGGAAVYSVGGHCHDRGVKAGRVGGVPRGDRRRVGGVELFGRCQEPAQFVGAVAAGLDLHGAKQFNVLCLDVHFGIGFAAPVPGQNIDHGFFFRLVSGHTVVAHPMDCVGAPGGRCHFGRE